MKNLTGQRLGRLLVLAFAGKLIYPSGAKHSRWLCLCVCGKTFVALGNNLARGLTRSCGCVKGKRTHGMSRSRDKQTASTYKIWAGMTSRCRSGHPNYGGRGIKVCDRWLSFENFVADMGMRPDGLTLERKDVHGDYCPENCKWADRFEQNNNTRSTRRIPYRGQLQPLAVVHREATNAITLAAFWTRIRNGWPVDQALSHPVEFRRPRRTTT